MNYIAVLEFRQDDYQDDTSRYFTVVVNEITREKMEDKCEEVINSKTGSRTGDFGLTYSKTVLVSDDRYQGTKL